MASFNMCKTETSIAKRLKIFILLLVCLSLLSPTAEFAYAEDEPRRSWFSRNQDNKPEKKESPRPSYQDEWQDIDDDIEFDADSVTTVTKTFGSDEPEELRQRVESLSRLAEALRKLKESKGGSF